MRLAATVLGFFLCLALLPSANGQNIQTPDKDRAANLLKLGADKIPDPELIRAKAKEIFSKPLDQETDAELKAISQIANTYANLVSIIEQEYISYYNDNYRYDFVQKKVAPAHDAFVQLGNEFKEIRNQAYFNLGEKKAALGQTVEAYLYYADAFRLSSFDCGKTVKENCMRWKAEQKMEVLLGDPKIQSFVTWQ